MSSQQCELAFGAGMGLDQLERWLRDAPNFFDERTTELRRSYFDSFDWRLHAAGAVLELEEGNGPGTVLCWRDLAEGGYRHAVTAVPVPRFARELPAGPLRRAVAPVLEMRALMLKATAITQARVFGLRNRDRKTVLRLVVEHSVARDPAHGTERDLGLSVRLVPVKGYPKPLARVRQRLLALGLEASAASLPQRALDALDCHPGAYSSKLDIRLDPQLRADLALKQVLIELLETIEINEAGTRDDLDSEFLHDLRVAVRRTRSALTQVKGIFPERLLARAKADFAWLGEVTGPTRDLDVYLLKFDGYRRSLPVAVRADLDPLQGFLTEHQQAVQGELATALQSARYKEIKQRWRAFLEADVPARPQAPNARRPILDVARERIWRVYRRVIKEGEAIDAASPAADLHELRKSCKKLRYLLEFFRSLFEDTEIKQLVRALKGLQENLGDFQDLEVQVSSLRRFSGQMVEEGTAQGPTLMAMGILAEGLEQEQQRARAEFTARFAAFASDEVKALFRELFAPAQQGGTR